MSVELNVGNITERAGPAGDLLGGSTRGIQVEREMQANGMDVPTPSPGAGSSTFSSVLEKSLGEVNELQHQADTAVKELVAGRTKNIHETMLAIERADASLKLAMQVRNKILDAYREVMRMQV